MHFAVEFVRKTFAKAINKNSPYAVHVLNLHHFKNKISAI
jgi:hypothetical protein